MFKQLLFAIIFSSIITYGNGILFLNIPNSGKGSEKNSNVDYTSSFYGMGFIPVRNMLPRKPKKVQFRPQDLYYRSTKAVYSPSMSSFCILYPDSCDNAESW